MFTKFGHRVSIGETANHAKFHRKSTKFGRLIERALLYKVPKICELWLRGSSWDAKILKVQRIFCNAFLVHRLAERDKIWLRWGAFVRSKSSPIFVNFGPLFREAKIFHGGYLVHFCHSATKICMAKRLANWHSFHELRELCSGEPAIPCGDMHQSFTDTHCKTGGVYAGVIFTPPGAWIHPRVYC